MRTTFNNIPEIEYNFKRLCKKEAELENTKKAIKEGEETLEACKKDIVEKEKKLLAAQEKYEKAKKLEKGEIGEGFEHISEYAEAVENCRALCNSSEIALNEAKENLKMAKEALTREVCTNSRIEYIKDLEEELLLKINDLGIGPAGLDRKSVV